MKSNKRISKKPNNRESEGTRRRGASASAEYSDDYTDFFSDDFDSVDDRRDSRRDEDSYRPSKKPVTPMRRKFTRIIGTAAILTVILVVGVVLSLTVLFKTSAYEVVGNTLYLESDIINTCGISEGENIFLAPKRPAEERIVKRFPYIESVNVTFSIPDTIRIEITQAAAGYLYKISNSEYLVISTKGRILSRAEDISGFDLPVFIGPVLESGEIGDFISYEDNTVLAAVDEITRVFADNGYTGITEINASDEANITFTYNSRIKVKLGIPEDLSYKIRTAMTIIKNNLDVNPNSLPQGVLDVSRCNVTKRSYFNEQDITATEPPTEAPSESSAESTSDGSYDSSNEGEYSDYADGSYDVYSGDAYTDDSYSDSYSDYGYN